MAIILCNLLLSEYGIGEAILHLPEDNTKIDSFVGENALQIMKKT